MKIPELDSLLSGQRVPRPAHLRDDDVQQLGLRCDAHRMWLADDVRLIDPARLRSDLSARASLAWPDLAVVNECESTNMALMALCATGAGSGHALTTEYQWGGRGRRGRSWLSPVGRNIALSVVWELPGSLVKLAGLSLAVGVACADALHTLGVSQVALKWPNDLIVLIDQGDGSASASGAQYAKLGGILVELQSLPDRSVAVIGIGLNFTGAALLRPRVEQPLADIAELQPGLDRTRVLGGVLDALADYLEQFATTGFAPMVPVWDQLHAFTGKQVAVGDPDSILQGRGGAIEGVVAGITATGELRLNTPAGERLVGAGEVSLRPMLADAGKGGQGPIE